MGSDLGFGKASTILSTGNRNGTSPPLRTANCESPAPPSGLQRDGRLHLRWLILDPQTDKSTMFVFNPSTSSACLGFCLLLSTELKKIIEEMNNNKKIILKSPFRPSYLWVHPPASAKAAFWGDRKAVFGRVSTRCVQPQKALPLKE